MICVDIPISNDIISEGQQQFEAVLTSTDNSVVVRPERATIAIDDEDGMLEDQFD